MENVKYLDLNSPSALIMYWTNLGYSIVFTAKQVAGADKIAA